MLILIICVLLAALDQAAKYIAVTQLMPIKKLEIIKGFFSFTYVENKGAAFGMLQGGKRIFLAITLAVIVAIVICYFKKPPKRDTLWIWAPLTMVASGAVGNAIDRLFRGYVVDFFDFNIFGYDFPVFNIADILVVVGTVLLAGGIIIFDKSGKE